jgi:ADP-ribose pyrophosphatase YjhB (NUDIX family)
MENLGAGVLPVADGSNSASAGDDHSVGEVELSVEHAAPEEASTWGHDGVWAVPLRLPMIVSDEVAELSAHYGRPVQRTFRVQADDYIYSYRFNRSTDRRAEVVFAIEDGAGQLWVHTKSSYPQHIFRLPTGGVHWDELVLDGLLREVKEETGLSVEIVRFLGIIEYQFCYETMISPFASYIFHLHAACVGCPPVQPGEPISEFRAVSPQDLRQLAGNLRGLAGVRRAWGEWRALAHDLVYDTLII